MKKIVVLLIDMYRVTLSPLLFTIIGKGCRYEISCSLYTRRSIERFGLKRGLIKGMRRLVTCHPFNVEYTN